MDDFQSVAGLSSSWSNTAIVIEATTDKSQNQTVLKMES